MTSQLITQSCLPFSFRYPFEIQLKVYVRHSHLEVLFIDIVAKTPRKTLSAFGGAGLDIYPPAADLACGFTAGLFLQA